MKQCKMWLLILPLLLLAFSTNAKADYATGLQYNGYISNVDAGDFSAPMVYDWNSDGKKDLIVGSRTGTAAQPGNPLSGYHGYVSYYENIGTNNAPVFGSSSYIQSCTMTCSAIDVANGTGG